jgi:prevent-host-death family protein
MKRIAKRRRSARRTKRVWQLQEAKARFSELVNEVQQGGYQTITKNGHPVAMLISKEEFEKIQAPKNTLLDFFRKAPLPDVDLDIERSNDTGRDIDL